MAEFLVDELIGGKKSGGSCGTCGGCTVKRRTGAEEDNELIRAERQAEAKSVEEKPSSDAPRPRRNRRRPRRKGGE